MSSGEKRTKPPRAWFLWQWSLTLWKLSLSCSVATYRVRMLLCWCFPWISGRCVESFLPRELLDNSIQKGTWIACGSVLCSKQGQLLSQIRLFRLFPLWSWKTLSFLQNRNCPASLDQLLSCWTILFTKIFLIISSLNIPDFHSCLLALCPTSMPLTRNSNLVKATKCILYSKDCAVKHN